MQDQSQYIYQFNFADYSVIVFYLLMLISVGYLMKKLCSDVKDYFIGGNRVSWWLAGASCFMMSFSAWTFTGAAGFAYKYGVLIVLLFQFNVIAYTFVGFFIAAKCRQTRCVTYLQIVYQRFGRFTEQFFTWIQIPMMLFGGAIWLTGLATFVSVAFGLPVSYTIILSGAIIIIYSTLGGSWGVMTTDFLQSLILMVLTIVIGVLTFIKIGGVDGIVTNIDPAKLQLFDQEHSWIWALAYFIQIFLLFSSVTGAPRFLAVKDGKSAKKAAIFAAVLFFIGPVIWFIPPIAASYFYPNIAQSLPGLANPQDGAYVLMGLSVLPHGLAGLLIMVVFAATLSSMDSAVNQNAAILCMNIYKPLIRPKAGDKEMFFVAHILNLFLGILVIIMAILFANQKDLPLFDLMLLLSASIGLPIAIPFFLVYWIRKAPRWSAFVSAILGVVFSGLGKNFGILEGPHVYMTNLINKIGWFHLDPSVEWPLPFNVGGILLFGGGSFLLSTLFWRFVKNDSKNMIEEFYVKMNSPVNTEDEHLAQEDNRQFVIIGTLAIIVGSFVMLLALFPNDIAGRISNAVTGIVIFSVGVLIRVIGLRAKSSAEAESKLKKIS